MRSADDIAHDLLALGLGAGDRVMIHASLKALGPVVGGAEAVLTALLDVVGPAGTLLVPTLSFAYVDEAAPVFDVRRTPCETGYLAETARLHPRAVRSVHPLSSVAAIGASADWFTADHGPTPCGPTSPYARLAEAGGWSLFIGVGFGSNSLFHVAEEVVAPAYLRYKTLPPARIIAAGGTETQAVFSRYDCYQQGTLRYLAKMEAVYASHGLLRRGTVGDAGSCLIPAPDNVAVAADVLQRDPGFILAADPDWME